MDLKVLTLIAAATQANHDYFVSAAEGKPLVQHNPALIMVDSTKTDPNDATKIAARITADGVAFLKQNEGKSAAPAYEVMSGGFAAPKIKRGGGSHGAPSKYKFDDMAVGAFFFVPNTDVKGNDAVKTVGSAVGAANQRYMEDTGATKEVTRAQRGENNKAIRDGNGEVVKETITVPVKKSLRHYKVSRVEAGKSYGQWTAPADGAVVSRES